MRGCAPPSSDARHATPLAAGAAAEPAPPLPAKPPVAPAPAAAPPCEVSDNEVIIALGDRRYRVRGLTKNLSVELMRINLMVSLGERFHLDTFDLYAAKARAPSPRRQRRSWALLKRSSSTISGACCSSSKSCKRST